MLRWKLPHMPINRDFYFGFPVGRKLTSNTISTQWGGRVGRTFELAGAWSIKGHGF
jgi:hypothetical protein